MNWNVIGAVSESLAAIGVVISLIYVAVQIRMSRAESRAASIDRLVELWSTFIGAPADNSHLAALMAKGHLDYEKLDIAERVQVSAHLNRYMRVFEAIYMHHLDGTIDEELWDGLNTGISVSMSVPMTKQWWPTRRSWYGKRFREYIDPLVRSEDPTNIFELKEP